MPTPEGGASESAVGHGPGSWQEALVRAGLLVETGAQGLYGLTGLFESIVLGITSVIDRFDIDRDAEILRFPPIMARTDFERTGYLRSFPDQIGSVHTFGGGDRDHASLLRAMDEHEDWSGALAASDAVLCSAVCHPVYATITSPLPPEGRRWNLYGHVFRHEADPGPARMRCFRQYEYVFVGGPDDALAHRDLWISRANDLLVLLGLEASVQVANDPFFGRLGRMLAANQQEDKLKYEVLCATAPGGRVDAVASANYHRDHFGRAFDLRTVDGSTAHSTCVGFGVERIGLALLTAYGLSPASWPAGVRSELWG